MQKPHRGPERGLGGENGIGVWGSVRQGGARKRRLLGTLSEMPNEGIAFRVDILG